MRFVSVIEHHDHYLRIYDWSPEGDMRGRIFFATSMFGTGASRASCMFVGVMNGYDPYLEGIEIFIFSWEFFWCPKVGLHRWDVFFHPKRSLLYSYEYFYVFRHQVFRT